MRFGFAVAFALYLLGLLPWFPLGSFIPLHWAVVILVFVASLCGLGLLRWKSWRLHLGVFVWCAVGCASCLALHYFVLGRFAWLRFYEAPGCEAIGPISVRGIPFPCFISAPGYSAMANIAGSSLVALVGNVVIFCGGLAFPISRYLSADARRIVFRICVWGLILGIIGTIRLFVLNWQPGGSVGLAS